MAWIALVGPELEENLSLRYLASSLARAGFRSEIIPFNRDADFGEALAAIAAADEPPIVVGLSLAFQWRAPDFLALAVALRERGYSGHITTGGHFATFAAAELLRDFPELSSVCRQEAESTLVALVQAVADGTELSLVPGLALRATAGALGRTAHPQLPDLATLPPPDRRGEPPRCFGHGIAPLVSSRGCYANCTFCCIAAWHEQSLPGVRYRLRDVDDVAEEMLTLQRERGVDIFVFHDDNFFVPGRARNRERIVALAEALERRGMDRYATVVKARPNDVDPEVFRLLVERLGCIRSYVGVETDADQGLRTLRRWSGQAQNRRAFSIARDLGLYLCFNLLIFDPDTTLDDVERNIAFMRYAAEVPFNFCRVELYAGTPLLARMQAEGRTRGDYLQWDYSLGSPELERVFSLTMACFHERNFGDQALANGIMATRFDIEVCRRFHPERFDLRWLDAGRALSRRLATDTADALDAIVRQVRAAAAGDEALVARLSSRLRATEIEVRAGAQDLARVMERTVGRGMALTELDRDAATSLQLGAAS